MMRLPNLNALRMFDAAARHLNFRHAAEELHLTQGAVAQQVRKLEADLGKTLFKREARGLSLTADGATLHRPVRQAMTLIQDGVAQLIPDAAKVTLSTTPSFAAKWLVPRMTNFEAQNPDIEVQVQAEESLTHFASDGVDLAIRLGSPPFGKDLSYTKLASLDLCIVGTAGTPQFASLDTPTTHTLIQDSHRHWDQLFQQGLINRPKKLLQFNQTALAMDAAKNGQGLALVPRLYLHANDGLERLWDFPADGNAGFYLVWPTGARTNRALETVKTWLLGQI
ncbi:LysR substrate-binding domain-containing protein [Algirhabdus cladophorae]|uniref:LysR substrate-binding domain-containing protein n=1 Tax=Algirhabdus cladophorae TaxID=3377108 RepID=UPI003B846B3B